MTTNIQEASLTELDKMKETIDNLETTMKKVRNFTAKTLRLSVAMRVSYLETSNKLGCIFPMVIVLILPHTEFGWNDDREDATHFRQIVNEE